MLILRTDNLPAAITACQNAQWNIYSGLDSLNYVQELTGFHLEYFLRKNANLYPVTRP